MVSIDRGEFVSACRTALDLSAAPAVATAWDRESTCVGMTVGGLTHHLVSQISHVSGLLAASPPAGAPIAVRDHYGGADWVDAGPDDGANASIRDRGNAASAAGHRAVVDHVQPLLERLPALLGEARVPDTVLIPWQGWALTTNDFLLTRSLELVIHSDDLAASVGLPTPDFPKRLVGHVIGLLADVAVRRHGATALVRTLSRPQRAPRTISAF